MKRLSGCPAINATNRQPRASPPFAAAQPPDRKQDVIDRSPFDGRRKREIRTVTDKHVDKRINKNASVSLLVGTASRGKTRQTKIDKFEPFSIDNLIRKPNIQSEKAASHCRDRTLNNRRYEIDGNTTRAARAQDNR
ncbi:hypothetical protein EVC45_10960 [Paraburkholderia sp. UYCP14C]|uniref:hypothetical protein n=1 Tax=Paraburkholderia sp. UYCP14C TaxID=2511130 RepID=UPI00102012D8|nr:hypothetical protein [Paraburkholderia sp. UYCP14C]RZF29706.1 hypothetical protein EVC45_10960 [Paraburkholderia sp. UYCP14C]